MPGGLHSDYIVYFVHIFLDVENFISGTKYLIVPMWGIKLES